MLHPVVFGLVFWFRRLYFARTYGVHVLSGGQGIATGTIDHNSGNLWRIRRHRTEHMVILMREAIGNAVDKSRILVVGPRNEAELMLLRGYGFRRSNIEAIDLISVSPWIKPMDMHSLAYAENSFDAIYAAWVIPYSSEPKMAIAEMIRALKPNGLLILGWGLPDSVNVVGLQDYQRGMEFLQEMIGDKLGELLWVERTSSGSFTCIARINK